MSSSIQRGDAEIATDERRTTDDESTPAVPPHGAAMRDLRASETDESGFDDATVPRHGVATGDLRQQD
jgi:hypothetical protein